jgi:colanic acid biosynthesis glycosyl transferase WcaI
MPDQQRLKLLVITMMYEPDCVGIAAVASDMCAALAERGHDVTVYTTYPYYPEWKLKAKANRWRAQKESIHGVQVKRHRIFVPSDPSRLLPRLIHELSFPVSLGRNLFRRDKFDVVMAYCPLMGGMVFAALRKMLFRDPLWVNIQDIPAEAAAASGMIKFGPLARLASTVQKFVFNRADVWSSISPDMVQKLEAMNSAEMPVHLCPNWLTNSLHEQILQAPRKVGRIPQQPTKLLYCGTVGNKQGLLQFCKDLSKNSGDFQFQIHGAGSEAEAVRQWVESSNDGRFEFDKLLSQSEFINAIHAADWFVIPQKSSAGDAFFPSKLIPSIFIGTPILAVSETDGPLYREVTENGLGLVVPWSQVDRLTNELDAIHSAPARFTELQENCVRRAEAFERETAIDKFEQLLLEQSSRHNTPSEKKSLFQRRSNGRIPVA